MISFFYSHPYLIGIVSCLLALASMPIVIQIAKKKNFVVRPNKRMSHVGEVPNIGGLAICFSFLLSYMVFTYNAFQEAQFLLIGVFAIVAIGVTDDILVLSPFSKLIGESLASVALIGFADIRITHLHGLLGINEIGLVPSYLLSLLIVIAIINAINLIDGVDGLASGLGIIYCLFFAIYFQLVGDTDWAILSICLIGALTVYFFYNVFGKKQKIFMGDSGSLLLGYMLAAFVFHLCEINAYHQVPEIYHMSAAPAVSICVMSIPVFDMIRVSLTRIRHHRSPFQADKNHIHHLLLRTGLSHLQTTAVLCAVSLLLIGLGILGRNWNMWMLVTVAFAIYALLTLIIWLIIDSKNA